MRFPNDSHLGQWWPTSQHGKTPEAFPRALLSLSPQEPSAIYCSSIRNEQEEDLFDWHVLATAGQSLVELRGSGPEGFVEESARENGRRVARSTLSTAHCHRLQDAVVGIRVLDMQRTTRGYRLATTDPWNVTCLLELASGELLTLPEPDGQQSPAHLADAERLATAVIHHLQGR